MAAEEAEIHAHYSASDATASPRGPCCEGLRRARRCGAGAAWDGRNVADQANGGDGGKHDGQLEGGPEDVASHGRDADARSRKTRRCARRAWGCTPLTPSCARRRRRSSP